MTKRSLSEKNLKFLALVGAAKLIEEGHGMTDVSCQHGSRWTWWYPEPDKGKWKNIILISNCDCGDPPAPFKPKRLMFRIRKQYFDAIVSGEKTIEYRKDSEFWKKRVPNAKIAVFLCGQRVHRRRILQVQRIKTPDWFSEQGQKDVDTPTCFAFYLGSEVKETT